MIVLSIGVGLEAVGLGLAAVGFRRTWREFSTGGRLFEPELDWARRTWRSLKQRARSVLRQPRQPHVHAVSAHDTMGMSDSVSVRLRLGPLPSVANEPVRFREEVERRIGDLRATIETLGEQLSKETRNREAADADLTDSLRAQIGHVENLSRSIAVSGLREQVYGWSCIALGLALQTVAAFISAVGS